MAEIKKFVKIKYVQKKPLLSSSIMIKIMIIVKERERKKVNEREGRKMRENKTYARG